MTSIPDEIRLSPDKRTLTLCYGNTAHALPAEYLRVCSPSAEVRGHGGAWTFLGGKKDVFIELIRPIGQYAVRLVFSDGHFTGIYSWEIFQELIDQRDANWQRYLTALEAQGKTREKS